MSEYNLTTWLVLMSNELHLDKKNVAIYWKKKEPVVIDSGFSKVFQSNSY